MVLRNLYQRLMTPSLDTYNVDGDIRIKFLYRCLKQKYYFDSNTPKIFYFLSLKPIFYSLILRHFSVNIITSIFLIFKSSSVQDCKKILCELLSRSSTFERLNFAELAVLEYAALERSCFVEALQIHARILNLLSQQDDSYGYKRKASFELFAAKNIYLSTSDKLSLKKQLRDDEIMCDSRDYVNNSFHNIINNKNILLVGPNFKSDEVADLRNYSVVVFLNYRRMPDEFQLLLSNLPKEITFKYVSYWGNDMANQIDLCSIDKHALDSCSFHVFKSDKSKLFDLLDVSVAKRTMKAADRFMVLGSGNLVQQCICDLVQFSPSVITIAGMDFWTGKVIYDQKYKTKFEGETRRYMFAAHNVYSNFLFTKLFYNLGFVNCSKKVENVLATDVELYAEALEYKYNNAN